jgi:tetratricopeptide (TPR) repeat protein
MLALSGCATTTTETSSLAAPKKSWWPAWFSKKPDANLTSQKEYSQYLAEQQNRNVVSPAMGLDGKVEPNVFQKTTTSISNSSVGKGVKNALQTTSQKIGEIAKPVAKPVAHTTSADEKKAPSADFYVSVAALQERSGNFNGAVEKYKQALDVDRNNLPALLGLARLYDRQGQLLEATKYYLLAVGKYPNESAAANDLALCYARQKRYDEAVTHLQKAVALQPNRPLYRNNLATVLVEQGRIGEAIVQLKATGQGDAAAHYNVGFLLAKRNQSAGALEQFQRALAIDPQFEPAKQWIASLSGVAQVTEVAQQPAVTEPSSRRVVSEGPAINSVRSTETVSESEPVPEPPDSLRGASSRRWQQSAPTEPAYKATFVAPPQPASAAGTQPVNSSPTPAAIRLQIPDRNSAQRY